MTFRIHTFGCKVNLYESEALRERLLQEGYLESTGSKADIHFVNTCAVTKEAERKDLQRVRKIHNDDPEAKIVVLGCSSQIHPKSYDLPFVSAIYGTTKKGTCEKWEKEERIQVEKDNRKLHYEDTPIALGEHPERAYVKVQDGCDNFCSYCLIPYARGNSRSRKEGSILAECQTLIANGVHELVIGGIDTGSYQDPETGIRLKQLLEDIASLPGDFRIRLSSVEITQIDSALIDLFATNEKICPHFHIPLQSGSRKICERMNRKYDPEGFLKIVNEIREKVDFVSLTTDVIAGFPGEGKEEFQETVSFLKKVDFLRIHAFPYSERPRTAASRFSDSVPPSTRQERVRRLLLLSKEGEQRFRKRYTGRTVQMLVESKGKDGFYHGYSENYLPLSLKSDEDLENTFVNVILS